MLLQPNLRRTVGLWRILTLMNRVQGNLGPFVPRHPDGVSWLVSPLTASELLVVGVRAGGSGGQGSGWMEEKSFSHFTYRNICVDFKALSQFSTHSIGK